MVSAGLELAGRWQPIELYVDSGTTYTILRPQIADQLGFGWRTGQKVFVQVGDGSLIPVWLHQLEMQIGPSRFKTTVGFSERLGVGFHLLGRLGVFEQFRICFHERRKVVSFQPTWRCLQRRERSRPLMAAASA
jgi:hypothetical protein